MDARTKTTATWWHNLPYCLALAPALAAAQSAPSAGQEVVIQGHGQQTEHQIDRKIYRIGNDLQATSGSAADVLSTIPSVSVDIDGNVSLRGDSKVLLLVDGKVSAQLTGSGAGDGLQQFSASEIDRIEVMTTAPAEYRANGAGGVINIVTKRKRTLGNSGSALANIGNRQRYVLNASGAHNSSELKMTAGAGLRQDDREREIRTENAVVGTTGEVGSRNVRTEHARRLIPSLKGALEYTPDERRTVSAEASLRERSGNRYFDETAQSSDTVSLRHSDGHEWSISGEERLRYKQALSSRDEAIDVSLHRSTDLEREHYAYLNTVVQPQPSQSVDHLHLNHDFVSTELSIDYRKSFSDDTHFKLGYAIERSNNAYGNAGDTLDPGTGQLVSNTDLTNEFRFHQTVHAAYASYEGVAGTWSFVTGLRGETTRALANQLTSGVQNFQRYSGLYPNLHLSRPLGTGNVLNFSASRRLSRPDEEDLNPYVDHQDVHNLRAGNPNLRPQETDAFEAGFRSEPNNYGVTVYLRRNRNAVTDVIVTLAPDVLLATKANLPRSTAGGVEFEREGSFTSAVSYRVNGNLAYTQIDATALGSTGLRSTASLNLKGSMDYRPTKLDTAQMSFTRTGRRLTAQGELEAVNLVNLGYKRALRPDLALVLTLSDAFNGQRMRRVLDTAALRQSYERHQLGQVFYAGLSYQFGQQKKASGFDYEQ